MPVKVVRRGDTAARLAFRHGTTEREAWGHGKNAWLPKSGRSPDLLAAGDVLHLDTAAHPAPVALQAGSDNRFVVEVPRVKHEITLTVDPPAADAATPSPASSPLANKTFFVRGDGECAKGLSDDQGVCRFELRVTTYRATLELPEENLRMGVLFGDLEPDVGILGVQQRLSHLRFYSGALDGVESERLREAVRAFQAAEGGLPANGELDEATRRALVGRHGS